MTSIKIKFRESKKTKNKGTCFLQLIHKRKMKTIATGLKLEKSEWDTSKAHVIISKASPQRYRELILIQEYLDQTVLTLKEIMMRLLTSQRSITVDMIVNAYKELNFTKSYFNIIEERIRELEKNGQKRTASNYQSALRIFRKFRQNQDIVPEEITGICIKEFELYLKSQGNSLNTISFYMRILQAVYHYALERKWIMQNAYPFKGVFTGEEKTIKRALERDIVLELDQLNLNRQPSLDLSRDIFMFSLFTRGTTFIDIAYLKKEDLKGNILEYKRHKAKQRIQISLPDAAMKLIQKYAFLMDETNYLFPLLYHPGRKKYCSYDSAIRLHNKRLKEISKIMKLETPLTSYVSRHTWATLAKKMGIATYIISDSMGHTAEETTRIYLDQINNHVLDQANQQVASMLQRHK